MRLGLSAGSKFLIVHSISKYPPSGIPYLNIYTSLQSHLHPAMVSVSLLSPPTVPGTAQNSSVPSILPTWLSIDSHQCSRPPSFSTWVSPHAFVNDDGCSTTVGFGEELVPPLMP